MHKSRDTPFDHVILISLDTLRSDAIGVNPIPLWPAKYPSLRPPDTSVLDELAGTGAFLANTVASAPYTSASHGSIFTGCYPLTHGVYEFYNGRLRRPTVFSFGARAGRQTILKVDFPIILGHELGFSQDVDNYLIEDDDGFIDAVLAAESSIACAHFGGVHMPYGFHNLHFGGDAYRNKVVDLEGEIPRDVALPTDQLTETLRKGEDWDLLLRYKRVVQHLYSVAEYGRLFELYLNGIEHFLRYRFAPFLERLTQRLRAARKTYLLVVFGDHGEEFDAESCGHFNSLSEGVLRIPVIFAGEGVKPGMICRERVRSVDILPTILDLAGLAPGPEDIFDGISLAGLLRGEEPRYLGRPALAQAYTADAREFVAYQKRQMAGEDQGPLGHLLIGEAAYLEDRRMTRTHFRYCDSFTRMEQVSEMNMFRFDDQQVPYPDEAVNVTDLVAMLDAYNARRLPAQVVDIPGDIRTALRDMGYRV